MDRAEMGRRARRQERVAKLVWGTLFLVMGVLFTLHDMGRIDLGEPKRDLSADHAVDGSDQTRWSSAFRDPQWLTVDLEAPAALSRIRINWEAAYAKDYEVQLSADGFLWNTVARVKDGEGGAAEHEVAGTARYVRILGTRRATPYGYSIWELQVFDDGGRLVSQGKHAIASSMEDTGPFVLWFKFWPLMLVAGGLPLLIAPRGDSNQVFGIIMTSIGVFLQLQNLGIVPWGFRQSAAGVLVVVGVVILLQSQRRTERSDEDGTGLPGRGL